MTAAVALTWKRRLLRASFWVAFVACLLISSFWALLLGIVYSAFGVGSSRNDQIAILLTYILDPIALVVWFLELRRPAIRPAAAVFIAAIIVASFWPAFG